MNRTGSPLSTDGAVVKPQRADGLARLALDSGGATTARSNDAGLALAKARKRMACTYALAIRDDDPQADRRKSVTVRMRRPGLTAIHALAYTLRSEAAKRESVLRAAHLAPGLYDTGTVRAVLLPIRPSSSSRWTGQIALSFPVDEPPDGDSKRGAEIGVVLRRGSTIVHSMQRTVRLEPTGDAPAGPSRVTLLESVDVAPGSYTLSAVLSDPAFPSPQSVAIDAEMPLIPRGELFLVGPLFGRKSGGSDGGFEPLVGPLLERPTDVIVVTQVCAVAAGDTIVSPLVTRTLRLASGSTLGELKPVRVSLDGAGELCCASLVDTLPAGGLKRGGEYVFEVGFDGGATGTTRTARLAVAPASDLGAAPRVSP